MSRDVARLVAWTIILAGSAWIVYGRGLDYPFIFDDLGTITQNDSIRQLWPAVGDPTCRGPLNPPPGRSTSGRPLVNLSFAFNFHFGGLEPFGYRATNLIIHLFSALLLAA